MKFFLTPLVLLFTLTLHAQIPDSLQVELPWAIVNVSDCASSSGEWPRTENEHVHIDLSSVQDITNNDGDCILRIREWAIVDWISGNLYEYQQSVTVSDFANTDCVTDRFFNYENFPVTLTPADVLTDLNPSHEYSFSFSDNMENSLLIDENSDENFELYVYDFTDNTVCKTNIYLTKCEDDIELLFPESVDIEFNQEPYIEVDLDMLGVEITYPCSSYTTKIRIGSTNSNILVSQNVGKVVRARVDIDFSDGASYKKYIDINVTGQKPDPIPMYIEEKTFLAGETVTLDVWSDPIEGLSVWQLHLLFKDTEVVNIEPGELFDDVPFNILEEGSELRTLWFPIDGLPIDVTTDGTWFTITLIPSIDGGTIDIFETEQDPWSAIGIEDENYIYEYDAEFVFNVAPRIAVGLEEEYTIQTTEVRPNPTKGQLEIIGFPNTNNSTFIEVLDISGKLLLRETIQNPTSILNLDISTLPKGVFVLKTLNGTDISIQKVTKI